MREQSESTGTSSETDKGTTSPKLGHHERIGGSEARNSREKQIMEGKGGYYRFVFT